MSTGKGSCPESLLLYGQARLLGVVGLNTSGSVSTLLSVSKVTASFVHACCGVQSPLAYIRFSQARSMCRSCVSVCSVFCVLCVSSYLCVWAGAMCRPCIRGADAALKSAAATSVCIFCVVPLAAFCSLQWSLSSPTRPPDVCAGTLFDSTGTHTQAHTHRLTHTQAHTHTYTYIYK